MNLSEEKESTPRFWKPLSPEWVEKLRQLRDQSRREQGGALIENSVDLLREAREERDRELDGSRKPVTLDGVEKLMQMRDQILQKHGDVPFENSIELLRQEREKRESE